MGTCSFKKKGNDLDGMCHSLYNMIRSSSKCFSFPWQANKICVLTSQDIIFWDVYQSYLVAASKKECPVRLDFSLLVVIIFRSTLEDCYFVLSEWFFPIFVVLTVSISSQGLAQYFRMLIDTIQKRVFPTDSRIVRFQKLVDKFILLLVPSVKMQR